MDGTARRTGARRLPVERRHRTERRRRTDPRPAGTVVPIPRPGKVHPRSSLRVHRDPVSSHPGNSRPSHGPTARRPADSRPHVGIDRASRRRRVPSSSDATAAPFPGRTGHLGRHRFHATALSRPGRRHPNLVRHSRIQHSRIRLERMRRIRRVSTHVRRTIHRVAPDTRRVSSRSRSPRSAGNRLCSGRYVVPNLFGRNVILGHRKRRSRAGADAGDDAS